MSLFCCKSKKFAETVVVFRLIVRTYFVDLPHGKTTTPKLYFTDGDIWVCQKVSHLDNCRSKKVFLMNFNKICFFSKIQSY